MTEDKIFFDNDCFSSFIEIDQFDILNLLYSGRLILPYEVYHELNNSGTPEKIKRVVNELFNVGLISVPVPYDDEPLYDLEFYSSLREPEDGTRGIGKGEAAALVYAKTNGAYIASNNLSDIGKLVDKYNLKHMTTASIHCEAVNKGIINFDQAEANWLALKNIGYFLPTACLKIIG